MSFAFYATDTDVIALWKEIFHMPGIRVLEQYSRLGEANRWFTDWDELAKYLITDGCSYNLAAWPEAVGGKPIQDEASMSIGSVRTILHSAAFIRLLKKQDQRGCLDQTSITFWSEKGALSKSIYPPELAARMDWKTFRSITGKIGRSIQRTAPAVYRRFPIRPDAWANLQSGAIRLWWYAEETASSPFITVK